MKQASTKMSDSTMHWGSTKMAQKSHPDDCAKLASVLEPLKTMEGFPNCFTKDDLNPDKVTIDKLGLMNSDVFGKYTRQSFAQQVRTQGNKVLRTNSKKSKLFFLFMCAMSFLTYFFYTSLWFD